MESEDLEFFEELIDAYQSEYDIGHRKIVATLVYLLQKERSLNAEEETTVAKSVESDYLTSSVWSICRKTCLRTYWIS